MKYDRVHIDAIGYDLPSTVVTSEELEARLEPTYDALHLNVGQLESLTGISERRWWEPNFQLSDGAIAAARKAMSSAEVPAKDIGAVIYAGVCRENFEPATACRVAAALGVSEDAAVYDLSNACLGVLNGMLEIANRIELGQIRAGIVVSCESAREINEIMIDRMNENRTMDFFKSSIATLTGGSGAVAILLTDGSFVTEERRKLVGGMARTSPQYYALCKWGLEVLFPHGLTQSMVTDSINVLKYGVELGTRTFRTFLSAIGWMQEKIDKVICHQVGVGHRDSILGALSIPSFKDFSTYRFLGNMGTVSLPLTAALAEEREFLKPGDKVGFLGIGSGLNCLMLGIEW